MRNRSILLVGGAGYIGSAITDHLLRAGHRVTCLDNFLVGNNHTVVPYLSNPNYRFVYGDMGNYQDMVHALKGIEDVVILAGMVGDPITKKYPELSYNINNAATMRCIQALNKRGLEHVIFVSSCSNYGVSAQDQLATEDSELKPTSLYAQSKIEIEKYIISLRGKVDYAPTILRFATAFGISPRMRFDLTINEFVYDGYTKKELLIFNPEAWRPYCHVADFARVVNLVLQADIEVAFEVFNAGGEDNNCTKQMLVDQIKKHIPDLNIKCWEHVTDPRDYRVSFDKIQSALGFYPAYSIGEGICELLQAIKSHIYDPVATDRDCYGNYDIKGQK